MHVGAGGTLMHVGAGGTLMHVGAGGTLMHVGAGGTLMHVGAGGTLMHVGAGGTLMHVGAGGTLMWGRYTYACGLLISFIVHRHWKLRVLSLSRLVCQGELVSVPSNVPSVLAGSA